jgi:hypothetical protein
MVTLPEKVEKFANWSGAKLRPQEKTELEIDLPHFVEDSHQPAELESTESLVESKFERNTAPWKNPKITLATVVGLAAAVSAIGFFLINSNFKWPTIGGPTLGTARNDDTEPVDHPDGKFQRSALTGPLGEGLGNDGNPKNPLLTPVKPAEAKPVKGVKTHPGANATPKATYPAMASAPPVAMAPRMMSRPAYTDYHDGAATTPARTVYPRTVATPSRQSYTPSMSTPTPSNSAPVQEKSLQERRAEAIAATSFNGGTSTNGGTSSNGGASSNDGASSETAQAVAANSQEASQGTTQTQGQQPQNNQYLATEAAVLEGTPQQLINRAKKAEGVLLEGLAFTPGDLKSLEDQEVTAEISNPLDSGLPIGTQIICSIKFPSGGQSQAKNAVIRLVPTAMVINGNEYAIPPSSAILTAKGGKPFIAKRGGSEFLRFLGSATKTVLSAGVGGLSSLTLGGNNILSSLTGLGGARGNVTQERATEVLILGSNLPVQLSIIRPFSVPMASAETTEPVAQPQPQTEVDQNLSDAELRGILYPSSQPVAATEFTQSVPQGQTSNEVAQNLSDAELRAIINQTESANVR